jgi:L-2,4-diaminobutyrate decarboxylase
MTALLTPDAEGLAALDGAVACVRAALGAAWTADGVRSGADPAAVGAALEALDPCPADGAPLADVCDELAAVVLAHGVRPGNPLAAAHLHAPPLAAAAAAELAIAATNQSLDSWEQAPAATLAEERLTRWLAELLGLGAAAPEHCPSGDQPVGAAGVMTAGGTASNLLGLTLARERAARRAGAADGCWRDGLPDAARRWRIVASAAAHESVGMAASVLGLGARSVVAVATDADGRMRPDALDAELAALASAGETPIALVATAGTTDHGAIDPLADAAALAAEHGAWLHVDAAVGSALALSPRLRPLLAGIERADSVTADLHKLWWQPLSASALLVHDEASFELLDRGSEYLHRADDAGARNLVGRSLDTSRRFDALKALVSLRATGRARMAAMVEHVVALAAEAGRLVDADPRFELLAQPQTTMVLFRWRGSDDTNAAAQRALLASGRALVGRTRVDGRVALKLTLINPAATVDDVARLLDLVAEATSGAAAEEPAAEAAR